MVGWGINYINQIVLKGGKNTLHQEKRKCYKKIRESLEAEEEGSDGYK